MQIECNRFLCIQSVSVEIDSRAKSTSGGYSAWRVVGPQAIFDLEIAKLSSASYGIDSPMTYTMVVCTLTHSLQVEARHR